MYNGHKSYNAWNVSLWINGDENLYRLALQCIRLSSNRKEAATRMLEWIGETHTPDGVPYTITNIMNAMVGMPSSRVVHGCKTALEKWQRWGALLRNCYE